MPPKRMTANPARPARHRPGKAPTAEVNESDSSSEDEDNAPAAQAKPAQEAPPKATSFPKSAAQVVTDLKGVSLSAGAPALKPVGRDAPKAKINEDEFETESEGEEDGSGSGSGSGSEEGSSEEEESSEEEDTRRKFVRPVFVKKVQRANGPPQKSEEQIQAEEEERRLAEADALIQERITLAAAEKALRKKQFDDEEMEGQDMDAVDDTDGLDPSAEYAAWKVRELTRIRRDRQKIEEREAEIAERERRRALTTPEREAEDAAKIAKEQEERGEKSQAAYMSKYHHKGAFYNEELAATGVLDRDIAGARFVDDTNKELLPEYMRIRDMTKLGKKGRTRYRDLKSEDTGKWGEYDDRRGGRDGLYNSRDERFQPDKRGFGGARKDDRGATGANASALGERKRVGGDEDRERKRARYDDD